MASDRPTQGNQDEIDAEVKVTEAVLGVARTWLLSHRIRDCLDLDDELLRDFLRTVLSASKAGSPNRQARQ